MARQLPEWLLSRLPQRVRDWHEVRLLEESIEAINAAYRVRMAATKTEEEEHNLDQEWTYALEDDHTSLGVLKTKKLQRATDKWDIDIPDDAWTSDLLERVRYIYPGAQKKLWRQISEARFVYWERWVKMLVPVLSLIVAILALMARSSPCKSP